MRAKWAIVVVVALVLAIIAGLPMWMFEDESKLREFVRNLILTALAVVAGIPAGLQLDHWLERRKSTDKRRQLLIALRNAFADNQRHLTELVRDMQECVETLPASQLDVVTLDATAAVRYELLDDLALARTIDCAHFRLRDVAQRIAWIHGKYQHARYELAPGKAMELRDELKRWRETRGMYENAHQRVSCNKGPSLSGYAFDCGGDKLNLIRLAVGLSDFVPDEVPQRPHAGGGAYLDCADAIAAIDRALGSPSQPK